LRRKLIEVMMKQIQQNNQFVCLRIKIYYELSYEINYYLID